MKRALKDTRGAKWISGGESTTSRIYTTRMPKTFAVVVKKLKSVGGLRPKSGEHELHEEDVKDDEKNVVVGG